jgi:hypothetical protein
MEKPTIVAIEAMREFPGLATDVDPADIPPGAAIVQHNLQSISAGKMTTRKGYGLQTEFSDPALPDDAITGIYKYPHAEGDYIITTDTAGNVKAIRGGVAKTIASGRLPTAIWSFTRDRRGHLVGINGRERGILWDGFTGTAWELGIDAPTVAPNVAAAAGGSVTPGEHDCYYRYCADPDNNAVYSNLSPVATVNIVANQHISWSGIAGSSQSRVTKIQLWRSLADAPEVLYLIAEIGYQSPVNSMADNGGFLQINTGTTRHGFAPGSAITVSGTAADDGAYTVSSVQDQFTFTTSGTWSTTPPGGGTSVLTGFTGASSDNKSDEELKTAAEADLNARLPLVNNFGSPVANRFNPPPHDKCSIAKFQDRTFYGADVIEAVGEVTTTAGSDQLTFSLPIIGFPTVGSVIFVNGERLTIVSSIGPTQAQVYPFSTQSGTTADNVVRPADQVRNQVFYSEPDEPESVPLINVITVQEQTEDEDEIVGLHTFGAYLYIIKERHIYSLSFARQPRIDAQARLLTHRGAFNKNCWAVFQSVAYVMDQSGTYMLQMDGAFEPLSTPYQNLFRDGTIDTAARKWFFVSVDYNRAIARFHVKYKGDLGTRPRRAICYSIRTGASWTEDAPLELAGGAMAIVNSDPIHLVGASASRVLNVSKQESEMIAAEIRGTVTAATTTSITDSAANFTDNVLGSTIAFTDGAAVHQVRTILERVGTTQLKIDPASGTRKVTLAQDPFSVAPTVGSKYIIGGTKFTYRTGQSNLVPLDNFNKRGIEVEYVPTTKEYVIWLRQYNDEDIEAIANVLSYAFGHGVKAAAGDSFAKITTTSQLTPRHKRSGFNRVVFEGLQDSRAESLRQIAFELEGIKADEEIAIQSLTIIGAE